MAEGDGAAVHVEAIRIDREFAQARQHLRGKRLVQFDEVDVLEGQAGRASSLRTAGTGPVPNRSGATPAVAYPSQRASGVRPSVFARAADISRTAAAPSLVCEELPAVTVPDA